MVTETDAERQARYLGVDAALTAASWLQMTENDARSVLGDVDPAVLDNYPAPNLSGEWADDPTPNSLFHELMGGAPESSDDDDMRDALADAWVEGVESVWSDALEAHALRVLGNVDAALRIERDLETRAERAQNAAGW